MKMVRSRKAPIILRTASRSFAVVPKRSTLPDGRLVVDRSYPPNEGLVKNHFSNGHTALFGLSHLISRSVIDLMLHPVIKARNAKRGHVVPFHRVAIFRSRVRQFLYEREKVNPRSGSSKRF
jgi:hypothetical protein